MKLRWRNIAGAPAAAVRLTLGLVLLLGAVMAASGQSFTVSVVDETGARRAPTIGGCCRRTRPTTSSQGWRRPTTSPTDSTRATRHRWRPAPRRTTWITVPDPNKRYYLSVLPRKVLATDQGYTMSGAPIPVGVSGTVTVKVHTHPIPTAQISVFVFEDTNPINSIPDQPQETGLAGFKIVLEDAGGRYGMSAGAQMMDAFGNPLGTVYSTDGTIVKMGDGVVTTDANGLALIQNLSPGKYGVSVVPPAGEGWLQTSTIEGTKINDAWVKAGEPPFFVEFGPPGYHTFFGFVRPTKDPAFFTGTAADHRAGREPAQRPAAAVPVLPRPPDPERLGRPQQRPRRHRSGRLRCPRQRGQHLHHQQRPRGHLRAGDLGREPGPDLERPERHHHRGRRGPGPGRHTGLQLVRPARKLRVRRPRSRRLPRRQRERHSRAGGEHPLPGRLDVPVDADRPRGLRALRRSLPVLQLARGRGGLHAPEGDRCHGHRGQRRTRAGRQGLGHAFTRRAQPAAAVQRRTAHAAHQHQHGQQPLADRNGSGADWRPSRPSWARPTSSSGARPRTPPARTAASPASSTTPRPGPRTTRPWPSASRGSPGFRACR